MSHDDRIGGGLLLEIHPVNLLSFGPNNKALDLRP